MSLMLLAFLWLTTVILDYLQYKRPFPYLTSIFHVAGKVYPIHHCMQQVKLQLIVSCVADFFSNQDSLLFELNKILSNSAIRIFFFFAQAKFLALLKSLKMNSFEFSGIFATPRKYWSCFREQLLLEAET